MDHLNENAAARERILTLVGGLSDDEIARPLADEWSIGAVLGHLAFWDRTHVGRLRSAIEEGRDAPYPIPDGLTDRLNDAGLPIWRALTPAAAVMLFEQASREVDEYLRGLDEGVVERVRAAGMPRLVERFRHRTEHADDIERQVVRGS